MSCVFLCRRSDSVLIGGFPPGRWISSDLRLAKRVVSSSCGRFNLHNPVSGMMMQQKNPCSTFTFDSAAAEENQQVGRKNPQIRPSSSTLLTLGEFWSEKGSDTFRKPRVHSIL